MPVSIGWRWGVHRSRMVFKHDYCLGNGGYCHFRRLQCDGTAEFLVKIVSILAYLHLPKQKSHSFHYRSPF